MTDQPMDPVVDAPVAPVDSLQAQLRAAGERGQHRQTMEFAIPGYENRLWGTFRALDSYADLRRIIKRHERVPDEAEQELRIAADTILASSVDTFALLPDGTRQSLGMPIGLALAGYLGHEGLVNDQQALAMIFVAGTMSVAMLAGEINQWSQDSRPRTDGELAGNFVAPS